MKQMHITEYIYLYMCVCAESLSRVRFFVTPWTVAHQATLSMGFSRQEHWSGLPCLLQGIFLTQELDPGLPALQVGSLPTEPPGKPYI